MQFTVVAYLANKSVKQSLDSYSINSIQFNSIKKLDYTPYVARLFVGVGHIADTRILMKL